MNRKIVLLIIAAAFFCFILASFIADYNPGKELGNSFFSYSMEIAKILPFAFVLIGLVEVWVKKETIEKHLGEKAGIKSHILAILLGGMTIGPMIVALPV